MVSPLAALLLQGRFYSTTMEAYPLKFNELLMPRLWGGQELGRVLGKHLPSTEEKIGESWEVSGVPGHESVVAGGPLKGKRLGELYPDFELLIKFIDAQDDLSIQVHPDDALARQRHGCNGKTEMWYVVDAKPQACLYVGFARQTAREEYLRAVEQGRLSELLKREPVKAGDAFFIPAGTIHAIGAGCLIAEIQQSSDITYRVDDWGRVDEQGRPREMHTAQALDAIDFGAPRELNITRSPQPDVAVPMAVTDYFTTNLLQVADHYHRAIPAGPMIYICTEGRATINGEEIEMGQTLLVPEAMKTIDIRGNATLLEVYR